MAFRRMLDSHVKNRRLRFITIGGPSGIGKTALIQRFETIAKARKANTLTANHHPGEGILEDLPPNLRQSAIASSIAT